jgi:hypothetical protein
VAMHAFRPGVCRLVLSLTDPNRAIAPIVVKDSGPEPDGSGWYVSATEIGSYSDKWFYAICANVTP